MSCIRYVYIKQSFFDIILISSRLFETFLTGLELEPDLMMAALLVYLFANWDSLVSRWLPGLMRLRQTSWEQGV